MPGPVRQGGTTLDTTKYGKYIVTELKRPARMAAAAEAYAKWATRILWMDENVVPGAFQMNCSWYRSSNPGDSGEAHSHRHDSDEIIGFFGPNWQKPYQQENDEADEEQNESGLDEAAYHVRGHTVIPRI